MAVEGLEHPLQLRLRQAGASVVDLHHRLVGGSADPNAGLAAVLDRVFEQIVEQAAQGDGIAVDHHPISLVDANVKAGLLHLVGEAFEQGRQLQPGARRGGGGVAHEGQGAGDHRLHLGDVVGHLGANRLRGGFHAKSQPGEGGAQVVGDGADHGHPVVHIAGEALLHVVERPRRDRDFGRSVGRQGWRSRVATQAFGGRREQGDWRGVQTRCTLAVKT